MGMKMYSFRQVTQEKTFNKKGGWVGMIVKLGHFKGRVAHFKTNNIKKNFSPYGTQIL